VVGFLLFDNTQQEILLILSSIITVIGLAGIIVSIIMKLKANKKSNYISDAEFLQIPIVSAVNEIKDGILPIMDNPSLVRKGEVTHLICPAIRYITKNRVIGYEAGTLGASFRIAKGVTIRGGGIKGAPVRDDVTTTFGGAFVLTNKRIMFIDEQGGFESTIDTISTIRTTDDSKVIIQKGASSCVLHLIIESQKKNTIVVNNAASVILKAISLIRYAESNALPEVENNGLTGLN
jgi:hypothetical protein